MMLIYLASDVGGVAVEHGAVAVGDLARVVEHDHLGGEVGRWLACSWRNTVN